MNSLELMVHVACFLCVLTEDTVVSDSGDDLRDKSFSGNSGSGSGDGVFVNILSSYCGDEYRQLTDHTMCLKDDVTVVASGVSSHDSQEIVNYHNEIRANVQPPATDLTKLVWDNLLAAVADKWAKQCTLGHDKNRDIPSYGLSVGQNVAAGYRSWVDAMRSWFNEVELYSYGHNTDDYLGIGGWTEVAHYTQMVHNTTYRLGCGYAECTGSIYGRFYVCNYVRGQSSIEFPYTQGPSCSRCPHSCSQGLCDCGGRLCLNEGYLDISSCFCSCQALYRGDNCNEEAGSEDQANIDSSGSSQVYIFEPTTTSPLPIFVSKFNCTYIGQRSSLDECKSYGDHGLDTQFCESNGGQFSCQDCVRYYNVKTDYCPVMCALCPDRFNNVVFGRRVVIIITSGGPATTEQCDGKQCKNGGRLNTDTCLCKCNQPFLGDICDILSCPERDKWHCNFFHQDHCNYMNVLLDCPYLCDICD